MRKSFEGLSALVEAAFPGKLLTGSLFLFLNCRRTLIKILYWEGDGFAVWYKRLEHGSLSGCWWKFCEVVMLGSALSLLYETMKT